MYRRLFQKNVSTKSDRYVNDILLRRHLFSSFFLSPLAPRSTFSGHRVVRVGLDPTVALPMVKMDFGVKKRPKFQAQNNRVYNFPVPRPKATKIVKKKYVN